MIQLAANAGDPPFLVTHNSAKLDIARQWTFSGEPGISRILISLVSDFLRVKKRPAFEVFSAFRIVSGYLENSRVSYISRIFVDISRICRYPAFWKSEGHRYRRYATAFFSL